MKKIPVLTPVLLLLLVVSACSPQDQFETDPASNLPTLGIPQGSVQPIVIHHEPPKLRMNTDWVDEAGCKLTRYAPWSYSGNCSSSSPLRKMGCERIEANHLLGGLSFPVVTCSNSSLEPLGTHYVEGGCYLSGRTEALVAFINGAYQFVGPEDIRTMSVPIESPNEALSYVLASRDYYAMFNIELDPYSEYFVDQIDDTYIEENKNGYLIHLFNGRNPCGCDEHFTDAVSILVDRDGNIKLVDSINISKAEYCVD